MDLFDTRGASPMLIAKQCEAFDSMDYIYELKMDGFRCLAYLEPGMVDLRNKRNMRMLEKFPELAELHQAVRRRCILDGEIVVLANGVPDFYRLQKRTLLTDRFKIQMEASRCPASFVVFDSIYLDGKDLCWEPLMKRKRDCSFPLYTREWGGAVSGGRRTRAGRCGSQAQRQPVLSGNTDKGLGKVQTDGG